LTVVVADGGATDGGDDETRLVERVHASARALARRVVRGKQRADDIAQDVALDFLTRLHSGVEIKPERLDAYVATIVLRRRSDMRLRRRRSAARDWAYLGEIAASRRAWMEPATQWEERELAALYRDTLESLPARCRQAFVAVREDGQSYAEAARTVGVSVKMIAKLITQAQRVFRDVLRERGIRVPREKGGRGVIVFERDRAVSRQPQRQSSAPPDRSGVATPPREVTDVRSFRLRWRPGMLDPKPRRQNA
jgi:RNA polymerase sigma factor (sigma-70 family)